MSVECIFFLSAIKLSPYDPRFIGAWWLGILVLAGAILACSVAMFCFPAHLVERSETRIKRTCSSMARGMW